MTGAHHFTENDIRPADLMKGQEEAVLQDIEFLQDHKDQFVTVTCPACDAAESRPKYHKYSFDYQECVNCSTVYMNPRPSAELLGEFYARSVNYDYWNAYIFPASEETRRQRIFIPRVDRVLEYCDKYGSGKQSMLEVGAGFGTFCEEMQSRNTFGRIVAIEPTPSLSETCRSKAIETIEQPIEEVVIPENELFDLVVNFEVIEHLFSPKNFIRKCADFLNTGGLFVVTCPNGSGFDIVTLKEVSKTIDHEHLNYLNPASLSHLLETCGFEVLEVLTPGILDAELVRNAVLEGNFSLEGNDFLEQILFKNWKTSGDSFQQFLVDNKLSSNMWIIARKK